MVSGSTSFTGSAGTFDRLSAGRPDQAAERIGVAPAETAGAATNRVEAAQSSRPVEETEKPGKAKAAGGEELTEGEEKQVQELKKRDAEVRAHEQAHATVGGTHAGPPKYEFTTGPDGRKYAVSGEVEIDVAPVRDNPEATIRKMDVVIRAALAPAEPSSQDMAVARTAQQQRAQAQAELAKQRVEEQRGGEDEDPRRTAPRDEASRLVAENAYRSTPSNADIASQIFSASLVA